MIANETEHLIDVRPITPRSRHPLIFNAWDNLPDGGAILLVNDHDPLPLFYQFAAEHSGGFRWQYEEQGPEVWRVRITKGEFADPGFSPVRKARPPAAVPIHFVEPVVLDTRPIFARGETPCAQIDEAVAGLGAGQTFVLLAPFEPAPLYVKLAKLGFNHRTSRTSDDAWRIEFRKV